jgi:hypothetical protein
MSYEILINIDGKTYSGSYVVHAKSVTVASVYGKTTMPLGNKAAATVVYSLLEDQVRKALAKET